VSVPADVRATAAKEEAVAEMMTGVTRAVIRNLQTLMMEGVPQEISTVAVAVLALDQGPLTVIGIIGLPVALAVRRKRGQEIGAHAGIVLTDASVHQARKLNLLHRSPLKMNVTDGLYLCSSLLRD